MTIITKYNIRNFFAQSIEVDVKKAKVKIFQGSVLTQTALGGLTL